MGYGDQFLEKRGFNWQWTSVDMILPIKEWVKPVLHSKIDIGILVPHESHLLVNMLRDEEDLSGWVEYYEEMIEDANYDNILVARADNMIVGCVMILKEEDIRWHKNIRGKVGGLGCIGVRKKYREHGIGEALAAAVHDELKTSGYTHSYVGYTWLENWYAKMGYQVFSRQRMGHRG